MNVGDILTLSDIHHIIAAKFFLVAFIVFGIVAIKKKLPYWLFLLVTGVLASGAYLVFVNDLQRMFWGLQGDEITIAAMYEMFAHHSFFSDFAFPQLPPFYPPFFFWIFALVGKIFGWHGPLIAKFASATSILLFPIATYVAAHAAFYKLKAVKADIPGKIAFFLAPLICFIVIDWDAIILKPYELYTAVGTVIWTTALFLLIQKKLFTWRLWLVFGITGGLLFMTYYLWLVFAGIAIALAMLWVKKEEQFRMYGQLIGTAVLALVLSLPYLFPLVRSYTVHGSENWQTILMTMKGLSFHAPMFQFISWEGIVFFAGFVSLVALRKKLYGRFFLLLFLSSYIWQVMGFSTIFFFDTPIQEFKGFYFFNRTILAFALAAGIEWLWNVVSRKYSHISSWKETTLFVGLIFLSTQMIFGFFLDDPVVQNRRVASRQLSKVQGELITFLQTDRQACDCMPLTLHGGMGDIHAFVPLNMYLYFNQHNTHPAAHFSTRKGEIDWLFTAPSAAVFHERLFQIEEGPIERFIFFKESQRDVYGVNTFLDKFPNEARDVSITVKKSFFEEPGFKKVFENDTYVVFDTQKLGTEQ